MHITKIGSLYCLYLKPLKQQILRNILYVHRPYLILPYFDALRRQYLVLSHFSEPDPHIQACLDRQNTALQDYQLTMQQYGMLAK